MKLKMYKRANGSFGVRNRIAVIPTVACVNHVAERIAAAVDIADAYTHPYGCDQLGDDLKLSFECLKLMGTHPNTGAVLVIGLGCEEIIPHELYEAIRKEQPDTELIVMQEFGGTTETIARGIEICEGFRKKLMAEKRVEADISELTVGLECGGSDFTSGIASNPSLGKTAERLCGLGARVVFGETTELMGAEGVLKELCENKRDYEFICERIKRVEDTAIAMKVDLRGTQPSPGNIDGGLTTIEEKSLGAVCKIGDCRIIDAIGFGEKAKGHGGITFVDTPGNDIACSLGLACAGAQVLVFTTGRGTPMGFAAAPMIKVTGNSHIASVMKENIDIDLSDIIDADMTIDDGGRTLFEAVIKTAEGEECAAERLGHRDFSLYRISPILT